MASEENKEPIVAATEEVEKKKSKKKKKDKDKEVDEEPKEAVEAENGDGEKEKDKKKKKKKDKNKEEPVENEPAVAEDDEKSKKKKKKKTKDEPEPEAEENSKPEKEKEEPIENEAENDEKSKKKKKKKKKDEPEEPEEKKADESPKPEPAKEKPAETPDTKKTQEPEPEKEKEKEKIPEKVEKPKEVKEVKSKEKKPKVETPIAVPVPTGNVGNDFQNDIGTKNQEKLEKKKKNREKAEKSEKEPTKKESKKKDTSKESTAPKDEVVYTANEERVKKLLELGRYLKNVDTEIEYMNEDVQDQSVVLEDLEVKMTSVNKIFSSSQFIWKIDGFRKKYISAAKSISTVIHSPVFMSHNNGYKLSLSLCPCGDGRALGTHMSIFFCILQGQYDSLLDWPFKHSIDFTLLDQTEEEEPQDIVASFMPNICKENLPFLQKPENYRNPSLGILRFGGINEVWEKDYIKDDTLFIKVKINLN